MYVSDTSNMRVRKIAPNGIITTIIGDGNRNTSGDNGLAVNAEISQPRQLAIDANNNLYIAEQDSGRIRRIDATSGIVTTVAGGGSSYGDGGAATSAQNSGTMGVALDASGNIYISDTNDSTIRKVTTSTGKISTIAGSKGNPAFSGDGGLATAASINQPYDITVDSSNNIYFADWGNGRIRKINASDGKINTVVGNANAGYQPTSMDGGSPTAASLYRPTGITVDASGNMYVSDNFDNYVLKVTASTNTIKAIAGGNYGLTGVGSCYGAFYDGGQATSACLAFPWSTVLDSTGNVYISDSANGMVRRVTVATGVINAIAGVGNNQAVGGDGGPALNATVGSPYQSAFDSAGNFYFVDWSANKLRRVDKTTGVITNIAGTGIGGYTGDGGLATAATLNQPQGIAIDSSDNIYIGDANNDAIRMITKSTGIITTIAGLGPNNAGYSGDGGLATAAKLSQPKGLAIASNGDIYFADGANNKIRVITKATGKISTFAGSPTNQSGNTGDNGLATSVLLANPYGVAIDPSGNVYVVDSGNNRIRKVSGGTITNWAGNASGTASYGGDGSSLGTSTYLSSPSGMTFDSAGNAYIADTLNCAIRMVSTTNVITTVAGPTAGNSGDGGPATSAAFYYPRNVSVDAVGNLYISDTQNQRIRMVKK